MPLIGHARAGIAFILVVAMLDIMSMGIIMPVLPTLITEFAGSASAAGVWTGAFVGMWAAMQLICSPIIGSLSDRYGRRPVVLVSVAGLAADFALMALAPDLWWLALGRLIGGITSSSFTTVFAYMADITPPEGRARAYGLVGAAFSGGFVIGPMVGGLLGELSPRAPFWAAAGISALTFLYGLFVLPESLPPEKRMAFSWRRASPFGALRLLGRHRELTGLALVNFLLYFAHHVFSAVYVLYAAQRHGLSAMQVGLLLGAAGALDMTIQAFLVGPVVGRFGERRTMVLGLLLGASGLAAIGLAPTPLTFALALLPNALWGLAMPTLQALMTARVSDSEQGQLQGANNSVASIAGIASPLFFGAVYALSAGPAAVLAPPGVAFLVAAAVLLAGALLALWVARREGLGTGR